MSTPEPRARFRHRRPWLFRSALGAFAIGLAVVAALGWLLATSSGAAFLLAGAGLKAEGLDGSLLGPLRAQRLEYRRPNLVVTVEKPDFEWSPMGLLVGELRISYLNAEAIDFAAATTKEKTKLPLTLKPPLDIRVEKAGVKRIGIATLEAGGRVTPRFEISEFALNSVAGSLAWKFERVTARTPAGLLEASGSIGALEPFPLDIRATLTGERDGRRYKLAADAKGKLSKFEAVVRGEEGGITGTATAAIEPLDDHPVKRVSGKLAGIDVNAFAPAAPHTSLLVEANLAPAADGAFTGPVRVVNSLPGPIDRERVPVTQAQGTIRILAPRYELTGATFAFANGGTAKGDIRVDGTNTQAKLVVAGVDLASWYSTLRATKLAGDISVETTPKAQRFEVKLQDPRFEVAGRAGIENQVLTVETARVASGTSVAVVQGTLGLAGKRAADFSGSLVKVDPSAFADLPAGTLNGKASVKGTLEGGPAGDVSFELVDSRIAGLALQGRGVVSGNPQRLARADLDVTLADARIQAKGTYGRVGDVLEVKLAAPELGAIGKALGQDISGRLEAEARLTGTFAAPAGTLRAHGEKLRVPGGIAASVIDAQVEVGGAADARVDGKVTVANLTRTAGGATSTLAEKATVTLAGTRANHRATLDAALPPDRQLAALPAPPGSVTNRGATAAAPPEAARRLQVALAGGLVEKAKTPTWQGMLEAFELEGPYPLKLVDPAPLILARDHVELGEGVLRSDVGRARLVLTRWTPTRIEARGSSNGLLTRTFVRALGLPAQARSNLVLAAEWDINAGETLDGFVRVRRTQGDVRVGEPVIALGLETFDISLDARRGQVNGVVAIRGKQIGRLDAKASTTIRKDGTSWAFPRTAPLTGEISADVPSLAWASDWLGSDARLDGKVNARVALAGTLAAPSFRGDLALDGLQLRDSSHGFEIDQGRVGIALRDHEVAIERFELASAWRVPPNAETAFENVKMPEKGTISATGRIDFLKRTGAITVKSQAYPVSQLPARFIAATGEAKLEAGEAGLSLAGAFKADAGYIGLGTASSPRPSDDVLVDRGTGVEERKAERVNLDLRFQLGDRLFFDGRGLFTRLTGDLRVRGDPGRTLVASGQIRTIRGNYDAYGQKLAIERGVLTFQGPIDNPQLNVLAVRQGENLPVVAGVEVIGNVSRPVVRLYSRPDVPDPEKLSWLVLGRGPTDAAEGDAATLFAAANALLGGGNAENRKLVRQLGFDDVSIGRSGVSALGMPQSSIAGKTGSTVGNETVSVGKRLTKDLYVSYQQGLADAESSVRFAYQVTRRLQLLLIAGDKPGVDAVYRFTFGRERRGAARSGSDQGQTGVRSGSDQGQGRNTQN